MEKQYNNILKNKIKDSLCKCGDSETFARGKNKTKHLMSIYPRILQGISHTSFHF